jgi:hypothetical protein
MDEHTEAIRAAAARNTDTLFNRARAASSDILVTVGPDASPGHLAAMAWLDGYSAGHRAATESAVRIIEERS